MYIVPWDAEAQWRYTWFGVKYGEMRGICGAKK
jgi:hypothetical protein